MKYMLLIYYDEQDLSEAEREQCFGESVQLAQELNSNGQYLAATPLQPTSTATSVRVRNRKRLVTDGPFTRDPRATRRLFFDRCQKSRPGHRYCHTDSHGTQKYRRNTAGGGDRGFAVELKYCAYVLMTKAARNWLDDFYQLEPERQTEYCEGIGAVETVVFYPPAQPAAVGSIHAAKMLPRSWWAGQDEKLHSDLRPCWSGATIFNTFKSDASFNVMKA
jgi:hypothetical protein